MQVSVRKRSGLVETGFLICKNPSLPFHVIQNWIVVKGSGAMPFAGQLVLEIKPPPFGKTTAIKEGKVTL